MESKAVAQFRSSAALSAAIPMTVDTIINAVNLGSTEKALKIKIAQEKATAVMMQVKTMKDVITKEPAAALLPLTRYIELISMLV